MQKKLFCLTDMTFLIIARKMVECVKCSAIFETVYSWKTTCTYCDKIYLFKTRLENYVYYSNCKYIGKPTDMELYESSKMILKIKYRVTRHGHTGYCVKPGHKQTTIYDMELMLPVLKIFNLLFNENLNGKAKILNKYYGLEQQKCIQGSGSCEFGFIKADIIDAEIIS